MTGTDVLVIRSPYDGREIAQVPLASADEADRACATAEAAFAETKRLAAWQREQILERIAARLAAETDDLARLLALEAGKPIRDARGEIGRAVRTFRIAAEEAKRIGGEILPLDWTSGSDGRMALVRRFPIGTILGITAFNYPVLLAAHKVAPAIASGNPIILKPAPQTPVTTLRLATIISESGWPAGAISVLPCSNDVACRLLHDDRIRKLSFTGSAAVGWQLKAAVPKKRVTLELGGNAAVIVHEDADVDRAAQRIVAGGFAYSGQSCISVQRVFVQEHIRTALAERVVAGAKALVVGDPMDERTQIGPMISEAAAMRAESWIQEAVAAGAQLLTGGERRGATLTPSVLAEVPATARLSREEVFAPVVFLNSYSDFSDALQQVNASKYGLQAGIFTHDWGRITEAWRTLNVGAVLIDEVSAWRADHMPYGGTKDSGTGREGVRSAIEEMTEPRLLIVTV